MNDELQDLSREELIEIIIDSSKLWLAHDGLWFQAVENHIDMETAILLDGHAWERFTVIEAKRIMNRLGMKPGGGIPNLIKALKYRLYAPTAMFTEDDIICVLGKLRPVAEAYEPPTSPFEFPEPTDGYDDPATHI